jgi:hypothetical protein
MQLRLLYTIAMFSFGIGFLFGQSKDAARSYPQFAELSKGDATRLDQQRAVVAEAAKRRYGTARLTKTTADLPILQSLIDDQVFGKTQTYQLQCLGVAFGDVLANEFPLRWVMIPDEYGTDPTLRFKKTTWNVNALTMISKRIERDERVDVYQLLRITRQQLSDLETTVR